MVQTVLVAARWLHFMSVMVLLGAALFPLLAPPASSRSPRSVLLHQSAALLPLATVIAVLSGLAWLAATLATMNDGFAGAADPGFLQTFFTETLFGPIEAVRLAIFAGLVLALLMPPGPTRLIVTASLAAGLLLSQAWLGHAAEGGDTWLGWSMMASYGAHVLAVGVWIGSLPSLLLFVRSSNVIGSAGLVVVLHRYSTLATVAALVVLGTGVANSAFRVGAAVRDLTGSNYGRILIGKLALVAVVLLLAAISRFRLLPRLGRHASDKGRVVGLLRVAIGAEVGFTAAVLAVTALLGITPPPH